MRTVLIAYSIVWIVIFAYVVAQYNRIARIEKEIKSLKESKK